MIRKHFRIFGFTICGILFSLNYAFSLSYEDLLQSYFASDSQLVDAKLSFEQAKLSYEQTLVNNSTSFTLSTGSAKIDFKNDSTNFSLSPFISANLPQLSNTEIKLSAPLNIASNAAGTTTSLQNAGLSFSTDIISEKNDQTAITFERSKRSILEASRKVESRKILLEKALLNEIKSLYNSKQEIMEAEQNLLSKSNSLKILQLQGYSEDSAKYRTAVLSEKSALFDLEKLKKNFEITQANFAKKCNLEQFNLDELEIQVVELLNIEDFDKKKYSELENLEWNAYISQLALDASKDFTLQAQGGVGLSVINNSISPSVSAGLSSSYKSISANASVSVPLEHLENPSVSFSLAWNPVQSKLQKITDEVNDLKNQQSENAFLSALQNYDSTVLEYQTKKESLLWQYEKNLEEYNLYKELETDTKTWFENGLLSEAEYTQAASNYARASIAVIGSKIEMLVYNIDLKSLFIE